MFFFFFLFGWVKRDDMPRETSSSFIALIHVSLPEWACTSVMGKVEGSLFVPSCTSLWCIIHRTRKRNLVLCTAGCHQQNKKCVSFFRLGHLLIMCIGPSCLCLKTPWTLLSASFCAIARERHRLYTDNSDTIYVVLCTSTHWVQRRDEIRHFVNKTKCLVSLNKTFFF